MFELAAQILQPSFSRGEVSPEMFSRVDLQAYNAGLRTCLNFFVRAEGGVSNRAGTSYTDAATTTNAYQSVLVPFVFAVGQAYVIEFGPNTLQVFFQGAPVQAAPATTIIGAIEQFTPHPGWNAQVQTGSPHGLTAGTVIYIAGVTGAGWSLLNGRQVVYSVVDPTHFIIAGIFGSAPYAGGGTISSKVLIATPYAAIDLQGLRYSQSADTLTLVHPKYPPYEFKRTGAATFTMAKAAYMNGPFLPQNVDGMTFVYASNNSGTVTITSTAPIFNANHVGALFQLTMQDLSLVPPWEANKILTNGGGVAAIIGQQRRSNGNNYQCTGTPAISPTTIATGSFQPIHTQGTVPDGDGNPIPSFASAVGVSWQYLDSGYGTVLITAYTDTQHVTGVVQPNYVGGPGRLPASVVGGPLILTTTTFSGNGSMIAFTPLGGAPVTDPNKYLVTINGIYQAPSLYTISGTTITFSSAPPLGTNNIIVNQLQSLGQTTYWAFGAFSQDQGYPQAVTYFPDRLILAGTPQQPVGVFASKTSQYHDFGHSNPIVASDGFAIFLNARQLNAISDLIPLTDLLIGTANIMWRLWPGPTGAALSPLAIDATPQNFYGESSPAAVLYGDSAVFVQFGGRKIRDMIYQFQFDKYLGQELTLMSRHLIPIGTSIVKMAYAPEPFGQLYVVRSDGVLLVVTYLREQQVIGWSRYATQGAFEDVAVIPEQGQFVPYVIVNRTVTNGQVRNVERFMSREVTTEDDWWFVDCGFKYDGRNTSVTSMAVTGGTTWLAGDVGTLTASGTIGWAQFQTTDPGYNNVIWLYDANGQLARMLITAYLSATQVTVKFMDPVPADLHAVPTLVWGFARTMFSGAGPIGGMQVSAYVDSNAIVGATLGADGTLTLPNAGVVVTVGLPYNSDFETLHLNLQGQETIRAKAKWIPDVALDVTESRNFLAGTDFNTLLPSKERAYETYLSSTNMQEGILITRLNSELTPEAHVCIRQNMPLPITIRGIIPSINVGRLAG